MTHPAHTFDPSVLREYDIRGLVNQNLSDADALAIGCAFGTIVKRDAKDGQATVCVAYDGRETSPSYAANLIKGLASTGVNVEDMGEGPTPMLYFAVKHRKAAGGIMITGSHNPSEYNGFKMTLQEKPFFGDEITLVGNIAKAGDYEQGEGSVSEVDIKDIYVDRLIQDLKLDLVNDNPLNIVWDNGNGAAGEILRRLTAKLPGKHILLFDEIDGTFPNHHPDPTVDENLQDLIKAVKDNNYDLGIAFDGDGDRIGTVDEKGTIIRCDALMTVYAKDVLARNPGAAIIGDVKCSQVMFDEINRMGGKAIMWNTGHSLVKSKMMEENSPLAGELSGHIFFKDGYYGYDDALYCAVRLMNAVAENKAENDAPFSSMFAHLPQLFNTPEVRIEVDEEIKFGLVPQIAENLKPQANDDFQINDRDGVRVTTPQGWWLLRPSNTQNVLVSRVESDSEEGLAALKAMVEAEVANVGIEFKFSA